jgi:hypothetical protein
MNIMDVSDLGKVTTGINGLIYFASSGEIKRVYFKKPILHLPAVRL